MTAKPEICHSNLTGRWYLVMSRLKDGSAKRKVDITDEIHRILREFGNFAQVGPR